MTLKLAAKPCQGVPRLGFETTGFGMDGRPALPVLHRGTRSPGSSSCGGSLLVREGRRLVPTVNVWGSNTRSTLSHAWLGTLVLQHASRTGEPPAASQQA